MPRRMLMYPATALLLAVMMALLLHPADSNTSFSGAHIGLGAEAASAAGPVASPTPRPSTPTPAPYPPSGPAGGKGDNNRPPASPAPNESFDVRHAPSIDAATIDQVLKSYNSPAAGTGAAIYNLGVRYGIDPAFCLAFFIHESTAGTQGVATVTKSVGNIRATPGYQSYSGFRKYASWEEGINDWYQLIHDLYIGEWGLSTIDQIVPVYAPVSDGNNTDLYSTTVKKLVSGWRAGQ